MSEYLKQIRKALWVDAVDRALLVISILIHVAMAVCILLQEYSIAIILGIIIVIHNQMIIMDRIGNKNE